MNGPTFLNALKAFEASARHQSFSAAAQELNVTPAAVGQLVRGLEDYLAVRLFYRQSSGKNRLIATEVARSALPDIRAGFDQLSLGLEKLKKGSALGILTVTVSPAFAAKWLLPRIDKFQACYPETDVRLDTNLKTVDFIENGIDIGVRYGRGIWPGLVAEKLMDEEIFPVCSPAFYQQHEMQLRTPLYLLKLPLIHDLSMDQHADFTSWDKWLHAHHITRQHIHRGLKINNSAAVLQAAIDGQGIALARSVMADDDLKAGRLIKLYPDLSCSSLLAYYIVYREECQSLAKLIAFRDWLQQEVTVTDR
ncbi:MULTISPECIES: transcriptional regulator GcvA [unclassified Acinetobacter]|uniref:transcriptional regulator GcvA n=1 Tax=unclassified Acinetobacter TaxID=196816 RepID=UPI002934EEA1|nr:MULTISPECIES: transcriptional regulator GcvA [unclassified Acinetobacter]WOE33044.1 transcriptional regulator GcvA [Acinetobacter sp. SAAs470]WOE39877.1 transcriptional regulator GcvA [Acinetobacter sp. SAAs474]